MLYPCNVCSKIYSSYKPFIKHNQMHANEQLCAINEPPKLNRPFKCDICQATFPRIQTLKEHSYLHATTKEFECRICGEEFLQPAGLRSHRARKHEGKKEQPPNAPLECTNQTSSSNSGQLLPVMPDLPAVENLHKCNFCDEAFPNVTKLQNHVHWHTRRKCYKCKVCNRSFKHLPLLRKHQRNHARVRSKVKIKEEAGDVDVETVEVASNKIRCDTCLQKFCTGYSLRRHVKEVHHGFSRKSQKYNYASAYYAHHCSICNKKFVNGYSLRLHLGRIHSAKKHKCLVCNKPYALVKDLRKHYICHGLIGPYQCPVCRMICESESALKEHKIIHTKHSQQPQGTTSASVEKPFSCYICGSSYVQFKDLKSHCQIKHKVDKCYKCDVCGAAFVGRIQYNNHLKKCCERSSYKKRKASDQKGDHTSYKKWRGSKKSLRLSEQAASCNKPFSCYLCGQTFTQTCHLKTHCSNVHKVDKAYKCDWCDVAFENRNVYKDHVKKCSSQPGKKCEAVPLKEHIPVQVHTVSTESSRTAASPTARPFSCYVCGQTFLRSNHLKSHCREKHNLDKAYKCDWCDVAFENRNIYKKHVKKCSSQPRKKRSSQPRKKRDAVPPKEHIPKQVHTASTESSPTARPFSCYVCGQTFTRSNHLKSHCREKHNVDKAYKCDLCDLTFEGLVQYKRHMELCCHKQSQSMGIVSAESETCAKTENIALSKEMPWSKKRLRTNNRLLTKKRSRIKRETQNCDICGVQFSSRASLNAHRDIHFDKRPHSCRFCKQKFRQPSHMATHCKRMHNSDYPYQCDVCNLLFKGKWVYRRHQKNHTGPNPSGGASEESNNIDFERDQYTSIVNSPSQTEYACGFCDESARKFKSLSGLRRHVTIYHTGETNQPGSLHASDPRSNSGAYGTVSMHNKSSRKTTGNSSAQIYKCNTCSMIVNGWEDLEAHEMEHTNRLLVGNSIPAKDMCTTPDIEQTFECKYCGVEFDSKAREAFDKHQLDHELAAVEPMAMSYICVECDQEFSMANDLIQHHNEAH